MKKCPNCGNEMEDNIDRCVNCGLDTRVVIHRKNTTRLLDKGKEAEKKRKNKILLIEIITIIVIGLVYAKFFMPEVTSIIKENNDIKVKRTCEEEYGGTWDKENNICHTEYSDIEIN